MQKIVFITGATDGIGYETLKSLTTEGHKVIIHGRNSEKLEKVKKQFTSNIIGSYMADLSILSEVKSMVEQINRDHSHIDVIINNAGVYGGNSQYLVNTIAPYLLTKGLLELLGDKARVINVSSAAQARVNLNILNNTKLATDSELYAQSKLALILWTNFFANTFPEGPSFISVNPASMLGTKMVRAAYGVKGGDIRVGADILTKLSLSKEFENCNGKYFDNDIVRFSEPHPDAFDNFRIRELVEDMERVIGESL